MARRIGGIYRSSTMDRRPSSFRRRAARAGALALLGTALTPASTPAYVYWSQDGGRIGRANNDATMVNQSFITVPNNPTAVAVDTTGVYWTNGAGYVGHAPLSGQSANDTWSGAGGGATYDGVAVRGIWVYWVDKTNGRVGRVQTDQSNQNQFFIGGATAGSSQGIAATDASLFWGENTTIGRADIDGGNVNHGFIPSNPTGLATDATYVYAAEGGLDRIRRATHDGTTENNATFITGVCNVNTAFRDPCGVAVDDTHVYWTNWDANTLTGSIGRANRDGTGIQQNFITGLGRPTGVAVDSGRTPVPTANASPPVLSGTPRAGQVVSCSQGTWTGDLPLSYAYAWLRDGTPIDGATASTLLLGAADVDRTLQCQVTASGPGGSATQASGGQYVLAAEQTVIPTGATSVAAPTIGGLPRPGSALSCSTGLWSGTPPITFAYAWLRDGVVIPGQSGTAYTVTAADVGRRIACRVTGSNAAGAAVATSAAVLVRSGDVTPPKLSRMALSPTTFRAARSGPSVTTRRTVGTKVSYRISERATVTFRVRKRSPTGRYVLVKGSFARTTAAGTRSFRFSGRIGGRTLARGRYRLVGSARDTAGNASGEVAGPTFTIRR